MTKYSEKFNRSDTKQEFLAADLVKKELHCFNFLRYPKITCKELLFGINLFTKIVNKEKN